MFKINRIYESYKKGYAFKCLYALFWSVCPALIGRVARYTPSSELNNQQLFVVKGGAGGIRTLVQTGKPYAFYMLILAFGFRVATRPRPPIATLSSKISPVQRGIQELFPIYLHRLILRFGTTSLERCLVLPPCGGIKLIYCASIKQRERNCFRQLNL